MGILEHCSVELVKIAADDASKKPSYLQAMAATAPIAATQAAADIPEGWAEKKVETHLKQHYNVPILPEEASNLRRGMARGAGRLSAALITTPLFLRGMGDVKDGKDAHQKLKGYGEVVGAGVGFAGLKGVIEAGIENSGTGRGPEEVWNKVKSLAGARMAIGAGSGVLAATTAAALSKRQDKDPNSRVERFVIPGVTGAALGVAKGGVEHAFEHGQAGFANPEHLNVLKSRVGGKAAGGLMAGLVFNEIFRHVLGKEKTSAAQPQVAPQPSEIYDSTRAWADAQPVSVVREQVHSAPQEPEGTPARRAVYYALHDSLVARGESGPQLKERERVNPKMKPTGLVDTALVAAAIMAPQAVWHLGFAGMQPNERDGVLAGSVDRIIQARGIDRATSKKDVWGNYDAFYSPQKNLIAAGKDPMPETLAHELGHATAGPLRKNTIQHEVVRGVAHGVAPISIIVSLAAIEGFSDKSFTTPDELDARAKFIGNVGVVAAALSAPNLAEEATASVKAVRYLKQAGASHDQALFKSLRTLGPAFLTYAAPVAAPFIAAAYLKHKAEAGRKRTTG